MRRLLLLLVCLAASGCSRPKYTESTELVIVPGVGIRNLVAIGMSLKQVKQATGDISVRDQTDNHCVMIPSLGAVFNVHDLNATVPEIRFTIDLANEAESSPTCGVSPFVGSILAGPAFSSGPASRADIVAAFGEPTHRLATTSPPSSGDIDKIMSIGPIISRGETVSQTETYARGILETLWYPQRGIRFQLWEDAVMYVTIQEPVEPAPGRVPSKAAANGGP